MPLSRRWIPRGFAATAYAPPAPPPPAPSVEGDAAAGPACPNCDTPAPLEYCPHCGQAQHALHRSVRSIAADFLDTFAGWDGKIPVTLWLLFRHPGRLTAEYLAGRRARFLPPLRLYLILVVVLVLVYRYLGDASGALRINMGGDAPVTRPAPAGSASGGAISRAPSAPTVAPTPTGLDPELVTSGPWQKMKRSYFGGRLASLEHMSTEERNAAVKSAFLAKLGNMFLLLVPVFALLVWGLYRRTPFAYAEHLVFALHVHAFAAAALALTIALSRTGPWRVLPMVWIPVYLAVALRRVYGGSRRRTAVKFAVLSGGYLVALILAMAVTVALAFLVG